MDPHFLFYRSNRIFYSTAGKGEPIILIHGYQADSQVWSRLTPLLTEDYYVITPDLPGHGKTPLIQAVNSIDFLADIVHKIVLAQGLKSFSLVGHSMGGYVALAYADKYFASVENLFLINSHPFADTMTRVLARNRESDLIEQGKKRFLLRNFVKNNFHSNNHEKLKETIAWATELALEQPENGMLADLAGMMARTDRSGVFEKIRNQSQLLTGDNDDKNPAQLLSNLNSKKVKVEIIPESGHLAILENPEYIAGYIKTICN